MRVNIAASSRATLIMKVAIYCITARWIIGQFRNAGMADASEYRRIQPSDPRNERSRMPSWPMRVNITASSLATLRMKVAIIA